MDFAPSELSPNKGLFLINSLRFILTTHLIANFKSRNILIVIIKTPGLENKGYDNFGDDLEAEDTEGGKKKSSGGCWNTFARGVRGATK